MTVWVLIECVHDLHIEGVFTSPDAAMRSAGGKWFHREDGFYLSSSHYLKEFELQDGAVTLAQVRNSKPSEP